MLLLCWLQEPFAALEVVQYIEEITKYDSRP
jgi:hypothetical protein